MLSELFNLGKTIISGFTEKSKRKHDRKMAIIDNEIRLAQSEQSHNQSWELKQLDNAGWKDDVLFYAFIAMFIWAGFYPVEAGRFFENLQLLPEWFIKTWFWLIASVLGVKKVGDYLPGMIKGVKDVLKKTDGG